MVLVIPLCLLATNICRPIPPMPAVATEFVCCSVILLLYSMGGYRSTCRDICMQSRAARRRGWLWPGAFSRSRYRGVHPIEKCVLEDSYAWGSDVFRRRGEGRGDHIIKKCYRSWPRASTCLWTPLQLDVMGRRPLLPSHFCFISISTSSPYIKCEYNLPLVSSQKPYNPVFSSLRTCSVGGGFLCLRMRMGKNTKGSATIKPAPPKTRKPSHQAPSHLGSRGDMLVSDKIFKVEL